MIAEVDLACARVSVNGNLFLPSLHSDTEARISTDCSSEPPAPAKCTLAF